MKREKTIYSQGTPVKSLKKLAVYAIDFLLCVIISVLLLALLDSLMNITPLVKNKKNDISKKAGEMTRLVVEESKLSRTDKAGFIVNQRDIVDEYALCLTYQSLKENDVNPDAGLYMERLGFVVEIDPYCESYEYDRAFNYFFNYKSKADSDDFLEDSKKYNEEEYFSAISGSLDSTTYIQNIGGRYLLSLDFAKKIDEYIKDNTYAPGARLFEAISENYQTVLFEAMQDLQLKYRPYISLYQDYEDIASSIYLIKDFQMIAALALSIAIVYLLFPIIFKDGKTLAMKILKIGCVSVDSLSPGWFNLIIKPIVNFFEYLCILPIISVLFFNTDGVDMIMAPFIGKINLFNIGMFSLVLMLLSYVLTFVFRKNRQSLSELLSKTVVKDSEVYIPTDKEYLKHIEEKNGNR